MNLVVIDYGAGNVQSVKYALNRLGVQATLSKDPEVIQGADKILFPGVGSANAAMESLRQNNLDVIIPQLKQPFLGICLGMQLMCKHSQEGNTTGLNIVDLEVLKFEGKEKIPHMGWNHLSDTKSSLFQGFNEQDQVYFVHSYFVPDNEFTIASCDYMGKFSAAIQKDNFYAAQFHPEKSGPAGELILKNFIELV